MSDGRLSHDEIAFADATDLLAALARRDFSSRELLEIYLERIGRHNPALNAVVILDADRARAEADASDAARRRGDSLGPLHGLPITVKESSKRPECAPRPGRAGWRSTCPSRMRSPSPGYARPER